MDEKDEKKPAAGTDTPAVEKPVTPLIPEPPKVDSVLLRVMRGDETVTDAELTAAGVDPDTQRSYRDGVKSRADSAMAAAVADAGGAEQYGILTAWASTALSPEERTAFNRLVKGSAAERRLAVNGLADRYRREGGAPAKAYFGGGKAPSGAEPFLTQREMTDAMRDPQWNTSEAYREKVRARLVVTRMSDMNKPTSTRR